LIAINPNPDEPDKSFHEIMFGKITAEHYFYFTKKWGPPSDGPHFFMYFLFFLIYR